MTDLWLIVIIKDRWLTIIDLRSLEDQSCEILQNAIC
jgi:hypothetical protein